MRLQGIRPLRGLGKVARELGTPLTLIGGTASRAAMRLARRPGGRFDLFDLVPFSSDIDLEYDDGPERGPEVLQAIHERVPFASWFRWSLIDRERAAKAAAQREMSTVVPLRRIRFSTHCPPEISPEALSDLETGRVSFRRHPRFEAFAHDGQAPDAEIFGLMMALNVEADMRAVDGAAPGLDETDALEWLQKDGWNDLVRILGDPRLIGRFWTLFATRWSLAGPEGPVFETLTRMAKDVGVLGKLNFDPRSDAPIGLSKLSRAGLFRAPQLTPEVFTGPQAASSFIGVMNDVIGAMGLTRRIKAPEEAIDPSLELVAVAPWVTIEKLPKDGEVSKPVDAFESGLDDEFIQLSWPHQGRISKSGLTAQLLPYGQRSSSTSFSSVPAVGGVVGERAWIRIRLDDLSDGQDSTGPTTAGLVILQARHD